MELSPAGAGWELDANIFLRRFCRDDVHIVSTTWHIQNAQINTA